MQYFGYLQRNPDDAPQVGLNHSGWKFWLDKLEQSNGNFVQAEMVKAPSTRPSTASASRSRPVRRERTSHSDSVGGR